MMKKLISIITAFCLCGAFFIPAYAEENPEVTEVITEEVIIEDIIPINENTPLPTTTAVDVPETETTVTNGVFNTPNSAGTLIEDVYDDEVNRQFITVQTRGGNVFYIIIDNDKNGQNVYFLNAVDDFDLLPFSENFPDGVWEAYEELKQEAADNAITAEIEGGENAEGEGGKSVKATETNSEEEPPANNTQLLIVGGIGVLFLGGLVYFKFIKGKKKVVKQPVYEDEEDDEDDIEILGESEEQEDEICG